MRIIQTHEQADFDALASMLGAHLLDESSFPILPHRMNRNVHAFVTLYGAELPFIEARDLPNQPVERICLVDTQTMVSIRGVNQKTQVFIVDHHSQRIDLPTGWSIVTDDVGATTTLLVEQLRENNCNLSVLQATLLLIGIYEDTGSFTYSRTSSRDMLAGSFLLEQGANLNIVADYINHPLSIEQQQLYDELRSQIEAHNIHGHNVLIGCGNARQMDEELSTIAHKLRDLMDPDALFLIIRTRSGVQLIGRSTNDYIDVAEICSKFGGGGHSRAAACLIKGREVTDVHNELLKTLQELIKPAAVVAQIMSHGAQLIGPDVTAQEAIERMHRYGYEGYPVVQDGRVIGLLTRRAVDRAISHKIHLPASSLMEAGEVTIQPEDSIEHLQQVMTESGWGQIPVVSTDTKEIIGIVTRTDLLKYLTSRRSRSGSINLAENLEKFLSPGRLAFIKILAEEASHQKSALFIVGGFVRDLLLDRPAEDFDLVVEGDAISLAQAIYNQFGGKITTHNRFGTAKWTIGDAKAHLAEVLNIPGTSLELPDYLDLVSARTEFYPHPTALPTVERGNIKLDLHRRDFTINTLAIRLDGNHFGDLFDFWGGKNDLKNKLIRVLHSLSFIDDPTRILRAVRFEQGLNFKIESRTEELLVEAIPLLNRISGDRIRHELDHILDEIGRVAMLTRLSQLGVMVSIHHGLVWNENLEKRIAILSHLPFPYADNLPAEIERNISARRLSYILWLLDFPIGTVYEVLNRLKYPVAIARHIISACELRRDLPGLLNGSPSKISNYLQEIPGIAIYANILALQDERITSLLMTYLLKWRKIVPRITGYDLRERGIPSGPVYKRILSTLKDAWLDGEVSNVEEELKLLDWIILQERTKLVDN